MDLVLTAVAGLMGAAGVGLAAAAAHAAPDPRLGVMAQMLMVHAAAILALVGLGRAVPAAPFGWAGAAMALGVCLFSADLAARHWLGDRLFPFAAPLGGALTILSWALATAIAIFAIARR
ncbi:MAG: DUF423 domain-containing protein [Hyphomicrobiales bacterium]|nr:DUF423 domain-containing protein [Hyphomicrobiales bacterium]